MAVNWGEVFTNVTQNLVAKLPDIGVSVINAVVAKKLGPKIEAAAKPIASPAPTPEPAPRQELARKQGFTLPTWWPMAAGGAAILVVGHFLYKGQRRS